MLYSLGYGGAMLALAMLVPLLVSLWTGAAVHTQNFVSGILICGFLSGAMIISGRAMRDRAQELDLLLLMILYWAFLPLIAALPMASALQIDGFIAAYFETVSGLTTSGASLLGAPQIETAPLLVWRSLLGWIGGLWIIVFGVAVIAPFAVGGVRISDNPLLQHDVGDSAVARLRRPLRIVFPIYAGGTFFGVAALLLCGMPLLDAFCLGLSAISTTGFTVSNLAMSDIYSLPAQSVLATISFVGAISMPLLVLTILGRSHIKQLFTLRNDELRLFVIFIVCYALLSSLFLPTGFFTNLLQSISLASTTGFAFTDINDAPLFWTLFLPIIGGCALSAAGGVKVMRVVILAKGISADLRRLIYPSVVNAIRLDTKRLDPQDINSIWAFLSLFFIMYIGGLMIYGMLGLSFEQALALVITTLSNSGAILNNHNVLDIPAMSDSLKIASGVLMIVGRLELPVALVLFTSAFRQFIR